MAEKVDLTELERYLRIYQENPDSRVFAPLADLYRRLGRLEEALEIVKDGLRRHPYYAGGRVALSHILLDQAQFSAAVQEAEAVVLYYPENLLARKILIRALAGAGRLEDAKREWSVLRGMAPEVAEDPLLQRALVGPSRVPPPPVKNSFKKHMVNSDSTSTTKEQLRKKRQYLEAWLRLLGSA